MSGGGRTVAVAAEASGAPPSSVRASGQPQDTPMPWPPPSTLPDTPFPNRAVAAVAAVAEALLAPGYWALDGLLALRPTTDQRARWRRRRAGRCLGVGVRVLAAPALALALVLVLPLALLGLLLWLPAQAARRPLVHQHSATAAAAEPWDPRRPRGFTFVTANVCLLPSGLARFSNLGGTWRRAAVIGQLLAAGAPAEHSGQCQALLEPRRGRRGGYGGTVDTGTEVGTAAAVDNGMTWMEMPVVNAELMTNPTPMTNSTPMTNITLMTNPTPMTNSTLMTSPTPMTNPTLMGNATPMTSPMLITNATPMTNATLMANPTLMTNSMPMTNPWSTVDLVSTADLPMTNPTLMTSPTPVSNTMPWLETPMTNPTPMASPTLMANPTPTTNSTPMTSPRSTVDSVPMLEMTMTNSTPLTNPTLMTSPTPVSNTMPWLETPMTNPSPTTNPTPMTSPRSTVDSVPALEMTMTNPTPMASPTLMTNPTPVSNMMPWLETPMASPTPMTTPTPMASPSLMVNPSPTINPMPLTGPRSTVDSVPMLEMSMTNSTPLTNPTLMTNPTPMANTMPWLETPMTNPSPVASPTLMANPTPMTDSTLMTNPMPMTNSTPMTNPTLMTNPSPEPSPPPVTTTGPERPIPLPDPMPPVLTARIPPDTDFVCLQEVFDPAAAAVLRRRLGRRFPHVLWGVGPGGLRCGRLRLLGSGLVLGSRYPLPAARFHPFPNGAREDALANKGLLVAQVLLGTGRGRRVVGYLGCTHLQAPAPDATIRDSQLSLVLRWLRDFRREQQRPGDLVAFDVLCGDLNFDNCSRGDAQNQRHPLFREFWDPASLGPGREQPWAIGSLLDCLKIYEEPVSSPERMERTLADPGGRQQFLAAPILPSGCPDPQAPRPWQGRRVDRTLLRRDPALTTVVTGLSVITQLATLSDHLPVALRLRLGPADH